MALSPEQAHERLKSFQNPHYKQDQLKRIGLLGGYLSTTGQILIQAGPAWNKVVDNREQSNKVKNQTYNQIGTLKPEDRQKLFKALYP
jgi:hypothetical protein